MLVTSKMQDLLQQAPAAGLLICPPTTLYAQPSQLELSSVQTTAIHFVYVPLQCLLTAYHGFAVQVAGCEGKSSITVSGVCDQPHISTDPKQVFPRRAKTRPDSAKIARHFIMSSGHFEFGPLLAGKDSKGYR